MENFKLNVKIDDEYVKSINRIFCYNFICVLISQSCLMVSFLFFDSYLLLGLSAISLAHSMYWVGYCDYPMSNIKLHLRKR